VDLGFENYEMQRILCYFVIGEQLDDLIYDWIVVNLPPKTIRA